MSVLGGRGRGKIVAYGLTSTPLHSCACMHEKAHRREGTNAAPMAEACAYFNEQVSVCECKAHMSTVMLPFAAPQLLRLKVLSLSAQRSIETDLRLRVGAKGQAQTLRMPSVV